MIQLYYDIDTARRVNENNAPLTTLLQFYYNTAPQVQFRFLSGGSPVDLSAIKAWRAAIDTEFNASTVPVCRIENDDIDASQAETGIVTVTFNCSSSEFLAKLNNNRNVNAWLDIYGINSNGQNEFIAQMPVILLAVVDPEQGDPAAVPPLYPSADAVRAMIAGTNAYELARNTEFHFGDRAYYPGEPGYLLVCIAEGTSAATLPELDKTVNSFLDGTVTWQVYDLSESGGGAANITVNDVSPDNEGNIQLNAENISFNLKDDMGYDIPTSPAISNMNLQEFFTTLQYAIFSVNGYSAYIESSDPLTVRGDINIYGDTMFLTEDYESPGNDWDGNPLSQKTVYDLAVDVYTQSGRVRTVAGFGPDEAGDVKIEYPATGYVSYLIGDNACDLKTWLETLSYGVFSVNGTWYSDGTGNVQIYAGEIPLRPSNGDGDYAPTVNDKFSTLEGYGMFMPNYNEIEDLTSNTEYTTSQNGWLIIEWLSYSLTDESSITIDGQTFKLGNNTSDNFGCWQTYTFPMGAGSTYSIDLDEGRDCTIRFIPCDTANLMY